MKTRRQLFAGMALAAILVAAGGMARAGIQSYPHPSPVSYLPAVSDLSLGGSESGVERGTEPRQQLAALPPEQRQQLRQQMREHWQQMPPEERNARRHEGRERWQPMPNDERRRIREEMREQRGGGRGGRGRDDRW